MSETMTEPDQISIAGEPFPHESAHLHVSGGAVYADDIGLPANALHAALGLSTVAHARIRPMDLTAVREAPGVVDVACAADVPGENNFGPVLKDDPIFAESVVEFAGQALFGVAAISYQAARRAAQLARVQYEELPAILDVRQALAAGSFVLPTQRLRRGNPELALTQAPHRLKGSLAIGGQEHFYLEGQVAVALPQEDGTMLVYSSTQHPTEIQHLVAHALGVLSHRVVVQCRRMGGGFGGKESQPAQFACAAAVLAARTQRPVKLRLDRDADMLMTGKRHDFWVEYDVGFDARGRILGLHLMLASRCGYSADLSAPVNDRALCHVDNCYYLENVEVVSHRCKTNTVSNTAFRGFGGPQGMMAIEAVIDDIARQLRLDPLDVRRANFYGIARAQCHALSDDDRGQRDRSHGRRARREQPLPREARRGRALQRRQPGDQARHRAHPSQVRHLLQRDPLQPGRRVGSRLHRWQRAGQPRRHGDGPGPVHQGRPGRGRRAAGRHRAGAHDRHRHQQSAQHLGHRGLVGERLERQGSAGCGSHDQGTAASRSPPRSTL